MTKEEMFERLNTILTKTDAKFCEAARLGSSSGVAKIHNAMCVEIVQLINVIADEEQVIKTDT